jgi:cytochrome c6
MRRYLILCVVSALCALTTAHASEAFTMAQVIKGKEAYGDTCIRCHGINMVNSGTTVYDLRRFPKDEDIQSIWAYVATRGGKDLE